MGRNKNMTFEGIKQRVWKKLQGWKSKLFSIGGREILIKAVAQANPVYTMSLFCLPVSLCQSLRSMIINFWWGAIGDERKIHRCKWKLLCYPKSQGGMGFHDFISLNQALLAKQAWRILSNPQSLAASIYKAKYFPTCIFLEAPVGYNPSFVWRSLIWGRDLLRKGLRWRILNGQSVNAFKDPWLLRPHSFRPITYPIQDQANLKVSDLLDDNGAWNWNFIQSILWEVDVTEVKRITVGCGTGNDTLIWHYTPKGEYSVKSGYYLAQ